jgi:hypothetical protein
MKVWFEDLVMPEGDRETLEDAYTAVEKTNMWEFLRNYTGESIMMDNAPEFNKIMSNMTISHSGASFAAVMRNMQFIAKHGWNKFAAGYQHKPCLAREIFAAMGVSTDPSVMCPKHPETISYACMDCNH